MLVFGYFLKISWKQCGEVDGSYCGEYQYWVYVGWVLGEVDCIDGLDDDCVEYLGIVEIEVEMGQYVKVVMGDDGYCVVQ